MPSSISLREKSVTNFEVLRVFLSREREPGPGRPEIRAWHVNALL